MGRSLAPLQTTRTPNAEPRTRNAKRRMSGYLQQLLAGIGVTIELASLSLLIAFVLGLLGAAAKLSPNRWLAMAGSAYTTLIRAVPDLVLMLLMYYSVQNLVNALTDLLGQPQIDIDPFIAGVSVLGFIYGAYFTETIRGAVKAVPRGQLEAAAAFGLTRWQTFSRILFPQMMRFALPGISNNWQVILKATALVSIINLHEVIYAAQAAIKGSSWPGGLHMLFYLSVAGLLYLALTTVSNFVFGYLEKRYAAGFERMAR
jgi:histidine transport system permease protein